MLLLCVGSHLQTHIITFVSPFFSDQILSQAVDSFFSSFFLASLCKTCNYQSEWLYHPRHKVAPSHSTVHLSVILKLQRDSNEKDFLDLPTVTNVRDNYRYTCCQLMGFFFFSFFFDTDKLAASTTGFYLWMLRLDCANIYEWRCLNPPLGWMCWYDSPHFSSKSSRMNLLCCTCALFSAL